MSKQKKDRELFRHGAITGEAMMAYLNNELTAEEQQQIERMLGEDPFARDAMEGLQAAQNKTVVTSHLASINKKVRGQTGLKEGKVIKLHWANYAWAAVVLGLLVGIGFIMITYISNKNNTTIAENTVKQDTETNLIGESQGEVGTGTAGEAVITDSAALTMQPVITQAADSHNLSFSSNAVSTAPGVQGTTGLVSKAPVSVPPTQSTVSTATGTNTTVTTNANKPLPISAPATAGRADNLQAQESRQEGKKDEAPAKKTSETVSDDRLKREEDKTGADLNTVTVTSSKVAAVKNAGAASGGEVPESAESNATVEDAMKNFNMGNYKTSASQFDAVLKKQPDNKEALYFGGVSDYINGKTNKSEKNFDKLLNSGTGYVEGSKWYKANILIQKGKKEEAKKILNELSNSNGSYKERAANKLKEIN